MKFKRKFNLEVLSVWLKNSFFCCFMLIYPWLSVCNRCFKCWCWLCRVDGCDISIKFLFQQQWSMLSESCWEPCLPSHQGCYSWQYRIRLIFTNHLKNTIIIVNKDHHHQSSSSSSSSLMSSSLINDPCLTDTTLIGDNIIQEETTLPLNNRDK